MFATLGIPCRSHLTTNNGAAIRQVAASIYGASGDVIATWKQTPATMHLEINRCPVDITGEMLRVDL